MHDVITVGVPVLAILFGILWNQRGLDRLESRLDKVEAGLNARIDSLSARVDGRIDKMQSELTARIDRIQADLLQFYRILGEHGADIQTLKDDRRKAS